MIKINKVWKIIKKRKTKNNRAILILRLFQMNKEKQVLAESIDIRIWRG